MKKSSLLILTLLLITVILLGLNKTQTKELSTLRGIVKTGGSTSVEKVMNALIYQFQALNPKVTIDYEMTGSGDGIKNTASGLYEIGHSSRELKTDQSESHLSALAYAIDGIAVVLHPQNSISNLSKEQIRAIYTGKIKNWSEVGGKDAFITVVTREIGSGTRSAFSEIVGLDQKDAPTTSIINTATTCDNTGAVQTTVSQNLNTIGYISFSDVDLKKVKTVSVNGIDISSATLKDDSYQLKRKFYLVTKKGTALSKEATAFIEFVMSEKGQQIVARNKRLPVK